MAFHPIRSFVSRLARMADDDNRWRGVEFAGWTALVTGILTSVLFAWSTRDRVPPSFLFPYLTMGAVYLTTCVWILWDALLGVSHDQIDAETRQRARTTFWLTFVGGGFALLIVGLSGGPGRVAIDHLNWYLFASNVGKDWEDLVLRSSPFAAIAAVFTSLALATFMYLGTLCNGLNRAAFSSVRFPAGADAMAVVELGRRLMQFMVLASALMVTSTLTIYLLFATADQVQAIRHPASPAAAPPAWTLTCSATAPASPTVCRVAASAPVDKPRASNAAYMAMVVGIAFSGVLFILFMSCSTALDDRAADLQREASRTAGANFSAKAWREAQGFGAEGPASQVLKALALLAPAFTGLLTLSST